MKTNALEKLLNFLRKPIFKYSIFWSWNFIFILLLLFSETGKGVLSSIIKNAFVGYTPVDYSIYSLLIFIVPIISVILGFTILREKPSQLIRLFYGVEIPLVLLFMLRLFVFNELTNSTLHLFILLFFGILSFLSELLIDKENTPNWLVVCRKVGHSLLLIIGVYIGLVLIFYSLPLLWVLIREFFTLEWLQVFRAGFFILLFFIFFVFSATIIVVLPIALVWFYLDAFIRNYKIKIPNGKVIVFATLGINISLLFLLNISQPQSFSFEELEKDFSKPENIAEFNNNSEKIKKGLLNAYLSSYRYIGSFEKNNEIKEIYKEAFGSDNFSKGAQNVYNFIMTPFLYKGDPHTDAKKAEKLYEKYFDGNIQKCEKEPICNALKSTWDIDGLEAGLLNINQEKVHIEKQEITITEFDDIAEIEIYEVYKNMTFDQKEIFYYFSLPPNAVITGLWLSDDEKEKKKFSFNVSPRGAAQKVYKQEVSRRVDPSLLEQVGPNKYRLRAFPIEPRRKVYNGRNYTAVDGNNFHLWLSYKTVITKDNNWKLPILAEKRNVYWSDKTELKINNKVVAKEDKWLPSHIKANYEGGIKSHIVQVLDSVSVKMEPMEVKRTADLSTEKIGILIDGSYSMKIEKEALLKTLISLEKQGFKRRNISCFFINEFINKYKFNEFTEKLENDDIPFFGTTNYMEMVSKFVQESKAIDFNAFVLLSDKGNYEASKDTINSIQLDKPLYVIHVGKEQAPIYNDAFLETVQNSSGHVVLSINELVTLFNIDSDVLSNQSGINYSIVKNEENTDKMYSEIASKVLIDNMKIKNDSNRVKQLDEIHHIALKQKIVTSYSSMIVLVNDRQKEALKKAESEADRFDRKTESGNEPLPKNGSAFEVSGVPEPHEWILIFLVIGLLAFRYYQKKIKLIK